MDNKLRDSQLLVLWLARIDYALNSGVKMHEHADFYQLLLMIEGEGQLQINQAVCPIIPGNCYLFPPGFQHGFRFSKDSSTIDFKFQILHKELEQFVKTSSPFGLCTVSNINELKQLFALSCANLRHPDVLTPYRIDVGFKSAILNILQENNTMLKASSKSSVSVISESSADFPIAQYLREQIGEKITLEDISRRFSFHPHYLIELFRKNLDTTPMHYLQNLRLEKAKEYLEFTTLTVTEIADHIALSTPYFSRLFHNREGVTPSQYREQSRTVVGRDIVLEEDFLLDLQPLVSKN